MNKQPPSGGCVLKLLVNQATKRKLLQPPSGGCVLKLLFFLLLILDQAQPPSGGCVLKHLNLPMLDVNFEAAAFGRLCVET